MQKIYSIQMLRGVASLLVVTLHILHKIEISYDILFNSYFIYFLNIGVDIFFVISGFVMLYGYKSNLTARGFILNRVIRIFPLYWIVFILALAIYLLYPNKINSGHESNVLLSFFLIPSKDPFLIKNAWTLTYEFIFYCILSISFVLKVRTGYILSMIIIFIFSILGMLTDIRTYSYFFDYLFSNLLLEFLFGMILCLIFKSNIINSIKSISVIFISVIVIILFFYIFNLKSRVFNLGLMSFLICLFFLSIEKYALQFKNVANFLGNISYPLYLIHPFILSGILFIVPSYFISSNVFFIMSLFLSVVISFFVYKYIDSKLTRKLSKVF